jgi:alkylation response protein AidB-like acyl-CoA dehydrogenase
VADLVCVAAKTTMKVTTDAVQRFGGHGYVKKHPIERMIRDAKLTQIYEARVRYNKL